MSWSPQRAGRVGAAAAGARTRRPWLLLLVAVGALTVVRNLVALGSVPVGAYADETSIGYNAWALAAHGVDEHGVRLPLYPAAFGDYKNPFYVYLLALLLRVAPLTVTTERLPAALLGLVAVACLVGLCWRRTRSLPLTVLAALLTSLLPWLTVESRVGFEVISEVALLSATLLCLEVAAGAARARWWYLLAGVLLGAAVFAYSTARLEVALLTAALLFALLAPTARDLRALLTLPGVVTAYGALEIWNLLHPGALLARFLLINVAADGAPAATVARRVLTNYLSYVSPPFLFVDGDHNPRHSPQWGGMLLWALLPLLLAGLAGVWRRRGDGFARFVLLGLLVAPVAAAVTEQAVPHALRAATMVPFLVALAVEGLAFIHRDLPQARSLLLSSVALATLVQGVLLTVYLFGAWPARSALWFDAGELDAIQRAHALAGASPVLLSTSLDQPYMAAAFVLQPSPPPSPVSDSEGHLLAAMNMAMVAPGDVPNLHGAVAVLAAADPPPGNADLLFVEETPASRVPLGVSPGVRRTIAVYRLR